MASIASTREFRYKLSSTFQTTHSNAAESGWNAADGTAAKPRITAYDDSGLVQDSMPDETLQTRKFALGKPTPGLRKGSYKVDMYCAGAYNNTTPTPEEILLNAAMGGLQMVTNARSSTVGAAATTTVLPVTSANTYALVGQCVMVGVKGDGRGNGECKPINSIGAAQCNISIPCNAAPSSGDTIVFSDTVYLDEDSTQLYVDHLAVGAAAADQRQTISGVPTPSISGMGVGELPKTELEIAVADHQYVAVGDRTSLTPGESPEGQDASFEKGIGLCHIGDNGGSTRLVTKCGDMSVGLGVVFEEIPDPAGVNGIGGFLRMRGAPTFEATPLLDEDFGLVADFEDGTAKTVLFQLGHEQGKCTVIEFPKAYIDALPVPAQLNNLSGMKITGHGDESYVASSDLQSSPVRVHKF